jgi:hypothetical protein
MIIVSYFETHTYVNLSSFSPFVQLICLHKEGLMKLYNYLLMFFHTILKIPLANFVVKS